MANEILIRARKSKFSTQEAFGSEVANTLRSRFPEKKHLTISAGYAQKKVSLWESGQLIPTPDEFQVISELLSLPMPELKHSFSVGVLPSSAADIFRELASPPGQGLIASCFTGRVRPDLFPEDEEALREAFEKSLGMAIFFPYPLESATQARDVYSATLTQQHRDVWRTVVKFWKMMRSIAPDPNAPTVKLYRPRITESSVLFPPAFHRSTLFCKRDRGRIKVDLYTWTQGPESDGLFKVADRSLEDSAKQREFWELFFGDVYEKWCETGELVDGDSYWQAYTGASDAETD